MDKDEIVRTKILHRPDMHWRNGEVFAGCSCGTPYYPCETLAVALTTERQMDDYRRNTAGGRYPS